MEVKLWRLVICLPAVLFMAPTAWPQSQGSIGRVTAIAGQATVVRQGRFAPERLVIRMPVFEEDIIETAEGSKVRIALTDATVISLGEHSRFELRRLLHESRQQTYTARLSIASGMFRALVRKLMPPSAVEVITPTAVAAIRGTDLMGEVSADATAIVVLDGIVMVSNVRPRAGGPVTLTQGMGTTVRDDEPPSAPTKWSESRIEALRKATALP
jgi:hypothetical protein